MGSGGKLMNRCPIRLLRARRAQYCGLTTPTAKKKRDKKEKGLRSWHLLCEPVWPSSMHGGRMISGRRYFGSPLQVKSSKVKSKNFNPLRAIQLNSPFASKVVDYGRGLCDFTLHNIINETLKRLLSLSILVQ